MEDLPFVFKDVLGNKRSKAAQSALLKLIFSFLKSTYKGEISFNLPGVYTDKNVKLIASAIINELSVRNV